MLHKIFYAAVLRFRRSMSTAIIGGTLALIMHAGHQVAHGISNNPLTQTNQFITVINEL